MSSVKITPHSLSGKVVLPPSKSVAHRVLICAALAKGKSVIRPFCTSRDINATANVLRAMGAQINTDENGYTVMAGTPVQGVKLNCFESGSTARFLIPVVAALGINAQFIGEGRLPQRPFSELCDILRANGASVGSDQLPMDISGKFKGDTFTVPGNVSSQYISGILLAAPLMGNDVAVNISGKLESAAYVDMTVEVMSAFGVKVQKTDTGYFVKGGQQYVGRDIKIEADWSAAAFFMSAAAIGGEIAIDGLNFASAQGDMAALDVFAAFGAQLSTLNNTLFIRKGELRGIEVNAQQIPDMVPAIAATAAFAKGTTKITGAARLRLKESDRIKTVCDALIAMGVEVTQTADSIIIHGGTVKGGVIDGANDHRIVMAFAVAAAYAKGTSEISYSSAVEKSYPEFYKDFCKIGGIIDEL